MWEVHVWNGPYVQHKETCGKQAKHWRNIRSSKSFLGNLKRTAIKLENSRSAEKRKWTWFKLGPGTDEKICSAFSSILLLLLLLMELILRSERKSMAVYKTTVRRVWLYRTFSLQSLPLNNFSVQHNSCMCKQRRFIWGEKGHFSKRWRRLVRTYAHSQVHMD